ncbi:MAG TPA: (d)CMP kinase [Vicinamibacterales bacterium]|nr:(d)CMP kinase [Vicinamibacterales bacterium]
MTQMVVAIDGPSGVGKGTVARAVAAALGCRHVDTGAMYRAVAWKARREGVPLGDEDALVRLAEATRIEPTAGAVRVDGEEVGAVLRTPEIDRGAARVARLPAVRQVLAAQQRRLGEAGTAVMEGRDIGTVVFPDAAVKIYLDAAPEERARRRSLDPAHTGSNDVATVRTELDARDESDRTRAVAPLAVAPDAHVIDTTGLSIAEVVERVLTIVREKIRC